LNQAKKYRDLPNGLLEFVIGRTYVRIMEPGTGTVDYHESELIRLEGLKTRIAALQMRHLSYLDEAQAATADGSRSLSEWLAARLDLSPETAKSLVRTMRRTADRPDLRQALATGEVTFDRVAALSRIPDDVGLLEHLDVAGVRREAARRVRITAEDEFRTADERFLVIQPSLDESWWKLWGGLDGFSGALVDKVLTEAADQLPDLPDGSKGNSSWRKATALVGLCTSDDAPPAQVTVFVDARHAAATNGQSGVVLEAGPRVGADALAGILCDATTEVIARAEDGRYMEYGRRLRTAPPSLRQAILDRDGNACAGDGCDSRYRLETHHVVPWSQGGRTDPDNLITLCWFHHHIVVHERGFQPFRDTDHGRVRFRPPDRPS
jgi:5-methylcytosine-specific restriction endonuclease McrA